LPAVGAEVSGKACPSERYKQPAAAGEAAKGKRSPAVHPAKRQDAEASALGTGISGTAGASCALVLQGRQRHSALRQAVRPVAPAGGAALFLSPQELLRQSGLCPGDQRGISVL